MKRFGLFWAAMCLAAALATACGGSSNSSESQSGTATATASGSEATSAPAPASASAATITIASMNYGEPVTVPPGAQIAIKNNDSVEHSVTSDTAGKFTVDVDGNEEGTLTAPSEPGEYAFHCKYHPSMHGTLIVK
jgi:plastocyanin